MVMMWDDAQILLLLTWVSQQDVRGKNTPKCQLVECKVGVFIQQMSPEVSESCIATDRC